MARAKVLDNEDIAKIDAVIKRTQYPLMNQLFKDIPLNCGVRVQEAAWLDHSDVTDANGNVSKCLYIGRRSSKTGVPREVPMPDHLRRKIAEYLATTGIKSGPLFYNQFGEPMSPGAVQKQLTRLAKLAGLTGVSSHSFRRTFITRAARLAHRASCTLKDVQKLAGHADIRSTERYLELSPGQAKLVGLLFADGVSVDTVPDKYEARKAPPSSPRRANYAEEVGAPRPGRGRYFRRWRRGGGSGGDRGGSSMLAATS